MVKQVGENYFCVQFTYSILIKVVLCKTDFQIIFTSFFSFYHSVVRHGSRRSPSWLWEISVMALGGICHLWRLSLTFTGQSPEVTDFSQSNDGFLTEP